MYVYLYIYIYTGLYIYIYISYSMCDNSTILSRSRISKCCMCSAYKTTGDAHSFGMPGQVRLMNAHTLLIVGVATEAMHQEMQFQSQTWR